MNDREPIYENVDAAIFDIYRHVADSVPQNNGRPALSPDVAGLRALRIREGLQNLFDYSSDPTVRAKLAPLLRLLTIVCDGE